MFHKHEYNLKEERTLWCNCGSVKVLDCEHIWEKTERYNTKNVYTGNVFEIKQELTCKKCGEVMYKEV